MCHKLLRIFRLPSGSGIWHNAEVQAFPNSQNGFDLVMLCPYLSLKRPCVRADNMEAWSVCCQTPFLSA